MEADLQRFYNIDYRDRWRGTLTLRRINVFITHLPPDSAVVSVVFREGAPYWSLEAHLLDNVRMALTGSEKQPSQPHPGRPFATAASNKGGPERKRKIAAARGRARERRRQLAEDKES